MPVFVPGGYAAPEQSPAPAAPSTVTIMGGNPNLDQYIQHYNNIVQANGGAAPWAANQDVPGINNAWSAGGQDAAIGIGGQPFQEQEQPGTWGPGTERGVQDMSTPDRIFARIGKIGEAINEAAGFQGFGGDQGLAETAASFVTSLPGGMAAAPFMGTASLYEGATGKPITESDLETNQMAGEDLTGFQRAGAIGTGLVDTLGLFLGGSAEALSAGRNVFRAARGADAASSLGMSASKVLGRGPGAVAVDTVEEGAEEAFQSVMEDVRHDRLDEGSVGRALEGAAYGALGGAVMSGAGQMVNSALGGTPTTTRDTAPAPAQSQISEYHKNLGRPVDENSVSRSVVDYALDREGRQHEVPGSSMTLNVRRSDKNLEHGDIGIEYFVGSYGSSVDGAREAVADMLQTTTEHLDTVFNAGRSMEEMRDEVQKLIDANKADTYVSIERTPKTSGLTAPLRIKIDNVMMGNGLNVHPQVIKMMGGDYDGDMTFTYSGRNSVSGALSPASSRAYMHDGLNKTLFDGDYFTFNYTDADVTSIWKDVLDFDPDTKQGDIRRAYESVFREVLSIAGGNGDINTFGDNLSRLESAIYKHRLEQAKEAVRKNFPDLDPDDDKVVNRAKRIARDYATGKVASLVKNIEDKGRENLSGFVENAVDAELEKASGKIAEVGDAIFSKGSIARGASDADVLTRLNTVFYSFLYGGHPVFRNNGVHYYNALKTTSADAEIIALLQDKNVFEVFVKSLYSLSEYGIKVENAISNYISAMAMGSVLNHNFEPVDVNNNDEVKDFLGRVEDAINNANKVFNDLIESSANDTTDTRIREFKKQFPDAVRKPRVSFNEPLTMAREFVKMFGGAKMEEVFFITEEMPLYGLTIEGALDYLVNNAYDNPYFANTEFSSFWRAMLAAHKSQESSVGSVIEKGLKGLFSDIESARKFNSFAFVPKNSDETVDQIPSEVYGLVSGLTDAVVEAIGPQAALALRLADPVGFVNSTWGREMLSGNWKNFVKAYVSLKFTAKHVTDPTIQKNAYNLYDAMEAHENGVEDEFVEMHVEHALAAHASDSALDMYFYQEWKDHKWEVFYTIKRYTSLGEGSVSLEDLVFEIGVITASDADVSDLLLMAFKDSSERLVLSSITNRLAKARAISSMAVQETGKYTKGQLRTINSNIRNNVWKKSEVVGALKAAYHQGAIRPSRASLTAAVNSAYTIFKNLVEKGTSAPSASQIQEQVSKAITGGLFNSIQAMDYGIGKIHLGDFIANRNEILRLIFEPGSKIDVMFEAPDGTPKYRTLSHGELFRKVLGDDSFSDDAEASDDEIWKVFERYEQLLSVAVPQQASPIYSGGESSSAYGMATPPTKYIESFIKSPDESIGWSRLEDELTSELMEDDKFYQMIVAMHPELENVPLSRKSAIVNEAADDLVGRFISLVSMTDKEFEDFKTKYYPDSLENTIMRTIDESARVASAYVEQLAESSAIQSANNEVLESMSKATLYASLATIFEKHGLSSPIPSTEKSLSDMIAIGHLQDMADVFRCLMSMTTTSTAHSIMALQIQSVLGTNIGEAIDNANGSKKKKEEVKRLLGIADDGTIDDPATFSAALFSHGLKASDEVDQLVIGVNDQFKSVDDLINRCQRIALKYSGEIGVDGGLAEKDIKKIRDAYNGNDSAMAEIVQKYNGLIMASLLRRTSQGTGERNNPYAISQGIELTSWFVDKAQTLRDSFRKSALSHGSLAPSMGEEVRPPVLDLSSAATGFAITNIGQIISTAPIQTSVALEAANLNKIVGYGWLNAPNTKCSSHGRKITLVELEADMNNYADWYLGLSYSTELDGELQTMTESTINRLKRDGVSELYVYEPHRCSLLGCSKCTPFRRTLGGTLDALVNGTTEDANLRLKKTLETVRAIVLRPHDYNISTTSTSKNIESALREVMHVRFQLATQLKQQITDITDDIGMNDQNWKVLATAMTPYVDVTTKNNGVVSVPLEALEEARKAKDPIDSVKFSEHTPLSDLVGDEVTGFEVKLVGLDEMSSRIVHAVEAYAQRCFENDEQYSDEEARKVAAAVVQNWDGYEDRDLDIDEIFNRIPYVSAAAREAAYADHVSNPVVDLVSGLQYGQQNRNIFFRPTINWTDESLKRLERTDKDAFMFDITDEDVPVDGEHYVTLANITFGKLDSNKESSMRKHFAANGCTQLIDNNGIGSGGEQGKNRQYENILEMHIGEIETIQTAVDAYNRAVAREHSFVIPMDLVDAFESAIVDPYLCKRGKYHITIHGKKYTAYDTKFANFIDKNYQTGYQIAFQKFKNSGHPRDGLLLAFLDDYAVVGADAATMFSKKAAERLEFTHHGYSHISIDNLIPSHVNRDSGIRIMDIDEISKMDPDEFLEMCEPAIAQYEKTDYRNREHLRARVREYLNRLNSQITESNFVADATEDDCIGIVCKGNYYLPIFYSAANAPKKANVAFWLNHNGHVEMACDGKWNPAEDSGKVSYYGISFKSIASAADDDQMSRWSKVDNCGLSVYQDGTVDALTDKSSFAGRAFGFNISTLATNLYSLSVADGGNIFFDFNVVNGKRVPKLKNGIVLKPEEVNALVQGDHKAWTEVISGKKVFKDPKLDMTVRNIAGDILRNSGNSSRRNGAMLISEFLCPGYVEMKDGKWEYIGIIPGYGNFVEMVTSKYDRDDILRVYAFMNDKYCPPDSEADSSKTFFDAEGRAWKVDNKDPAKKTRNYAVYAPMSYMEIGGAFGTISSGARYSGQAMSKQLLSRTALPDNMSYNQVQYTQLKLNRAQLIANNSKSLKEKAERFDDTQFPLIDEALQQRVRMNSSDPILLRAKQAYRKSCLDNLKQFDNSVKIVVGYGKSDSVVTDSSMVSKLEALATSWNEALKIPADQHFSWEQITRLLRNLYAFSNNEVGFNELTFDQAKRGIEDMIASIKSDGLVIPARKYYGQKGNLRVSLPLLPAEYSRMLFSMSQTLQDKYHNNLDEFRDAMVEEMMSVSMPAVNAIDNIGKRNTLKRMTDGLAYSWGVNTLSSHLFDATYLNDIIDSVMKFGGTDAKLYADIVSFYEEKSRLQPDRIQMLEELEFSRHHDVEEADYNWSGTLVSRYSTDKKIGEKLLRGLVSLRSTLGVLYTEMPAANIGERVFNQGTMSIATHLGQAGIGPYKTDFRISPEARRKACKDRNVIKFWSAMREAQLAGVEQTLLAYIKSTQDIDAAIKATFSDSTTLEKINNKVLNIVSGKDILIEGQIGLFLDRFCMYVTEYAPVWNTQIPVQNSEDPDATMSLMEQSLLSDNPVSFFLQVFGGEVNVGEGVRSNDMDIAYRCMNWALRGDMAQKNLISAIYAELARRHAGVSFFTSAFVTPYFNYMTNRTGRLLQWVAPVSSIHFIATKFFTEGFGAGWKIPGTNITFGDMMLEDVQLQKDMKEAVMLDSLHLGPQLLALMLLGMGAMEPPEDEDKWGNFKEWTIFGARVDANWWLEDMLGLAIPYAAFGASCREGKPRLDLIVNGLAYYLQNNPVTKVADAVGMLFDPLGEFYRDYENDVEGYARAMGSPPSMAEMAAGNLTSFGLSFAAQFVTAGFIREIYNQGIDGERAYKKIFQENEYGRLTEGGEQGENVQYTTYQDAIIRKHTRNNPVMGLIADLLFHPNTGYMAHEMPKNIIYDPYQTDAMEYFSLYNDPYTKSDEKTDLEKDAIAIEVIGALQSSSVEDLVKQGFALDYETKQYVSKYIWDILAEENQAYRDFCESEFADFYYYGDFNTGREIVTGIKNDHYQFQEEWKSLYYDKLWSEDITIAKYNRIHTTWAQEANGEYYATGYYPQNTIAGVVPFPVTIASSESPGDNKTNMGREYDWQTESIVTGEPTGMRGLIPIEEQRSNTPDISSWSSDGTDTGLSDRAANNGNMNAAGSQSGSQNNNSSESGNRSSRSGYVRRGGGGGYRRGGGGGGRRSGGGGGGRGGYAPNIYSHVNTPNLSNPDTMRGTRMYDANYDYLRPDFATKGSREAYKRGDI